MVGKVKENQYEADHRQTKIDEYVEVELNEQGLFDEEINELPREITDLIEQGYEYSIDIGYFGEVAAPSKSESSLQEMTYEEINDVIGEKYEDEIGRQQKKNSFIDNIFGIKKVYAADVMEEDSKDVDGGTLKQAVILTYTGEKIGGCKKVLVYCANT